MFLETMQAAWKRSTGADRLTVRQLKRMFDAADGSGSNGRDDRKLTKAELILAMRRDGGQLAALLGLPSPVVSSMDEHRKFTEVFEALDCQRGSRSMITFDELHECVLDSKILLTAPDRLCIGMVIKVAIARRRYVDSQYRVRAAAAQVQIALAAGAGVLFALLLLACCYRARAQHPRKHDKST